jgi:hypothetical protein
LAAAALAAATLAATALAATATLATAASTAASVLCAHLGAELLHLCLLVGSENLIDRITTLLARQGGI